MLKKLAKSFNTRSLKHFNALYVSNAHFHSTVELFGKSKCSGCPQIKCEDNDPDTKLTELPPKAVFKKDEKFESTWATPDPKQLEGKEQWNFPSECCPKCDTTPFDAMYYKPSNKSREYQRTWWECVPRMVQKRKCFQCDAIPPETSRRSIPICPQSQCTQGHAKSRSECSAQKVETCPRLTMPCCRAARIPPKCNTMRKPKICKKIKCPFPSYSECNREDDAVLHERPAECRCLNSVSICEVNRMAARNVKRNVKFCPCPSCKRA